MCGPYSLGSVHPNTKAYATFETKPSVRYADGSRDTGGGYERVRSYEQVFTDYGTRRKQDVYVAVHRLCAVAWCYPESWSVKEILADLDGKDVHHVSGVEWDNREDNLEVMTHAEHSSVTQTERRAFAADKKRDVAEQEQQALTEHVPGECPAGGVETEVLATSDAFTGERCLQCAKRESDGEAIHV